MIISELISWARSQLTDSESALLDSRILLGHCLGRDTTFLLTWPEKIVSREVQSEFQKVVLKRAQGQPIAYLIGYRDFWTQRLRVSSTTLIPRPETELLVEQCLEFELSSQAKVLDLGTGTGAIALALASENPEWLVTGVDVMHPAVELANKNSVNNGIENVTFLQSDWFSALANEKFDLIVSNPPYVETTSPYLAQGDVRFEPRSALTSGEDGLDDIRKIIRIAPNYLCPGGMLVLEHGHQQSLQIQQLMTEQGYHNATSVKDLNHLARVTYATITID
jgi:release factor glutamine methyltransferase